MCHVQSVFFFKKPHSRQTSLGVCEMHVLGCRQLNNEPRFRKTVQFSSGSSELHLTGCRYLGWTLVSCCLVSALRHPISSNGAFLSCGRRAGWILRLSLLTTSLWSAQQSTPHMIFVTLTSCLFSSTQCHFGASMHPWCLVAVWQPEDRICDQHAARLISAHSLRSRRLLLLYLPMSSGSITPFQVWWSVPTLALKSPRRMCSQHLLLPLWGESHSEQLSLSCIPTNKSCSTMLSIWPWAACVHILMSAVTASSVSYVHTSHIV